MIRFLLLAALLPVAAFGEDVKATNTVCPVSGKPIDVTVKPVEAKVGDQTVQIGACCTKCRAKIEADPATFAKKVVAAPAK